VRYAAETPSRKVKQASRNRAQYEYVKAGKAFVGDDKNVDHKNGSA
tara:strand:- start:232 stop:369 length:138 start_codon:yes stop_codon:yes gene_type:complete